ncbi:MAG: hypothetical protein E7648_04415 [Ruminococcaceae bacterium]|nr:hypothetical protein [Oscillospiraceae bacterium]
MLKLIVGLKGSGKTKTIVEMANAKLAETKGAVVFIEKGTKLIHEVKHQAKLLDTDEYLINNAAKLYGFVAGNYGSNFDVSDIFIDSALKICGNDMAEFSAFLDNVVAFTATHPVNFVITSSLALEDLPEKYHQYL